MKGPIKRREILHYYEVILKKLSNPYTNSKITKRLQKLKKYRKFSDMIDRRVIRLNIKRNLQEIYERKHNIFIENKPSIKMQKLLDKTYRNMELNIYITGVFIKKKK
jgi:hypothetical protein